ncbi:TPA: Gp138 family membrane-puncturing spike protein, partial [Klebsiella pneumoniae]|nr:hypothetical protein [Klebsiella pneumoniae]HCD7359470.1 hypothetical protein [Klebsiella pneumoniae]HCI4875605.1 hypothetical protein [Klebsiella pneumoniae]HCM5252357.1 hypothetical protein [Klebsiella pneumoniae]HDU2439744.1 hypothetical protein [Klebsiella pneumoniae]
MAVSDKTRSGALAQVLVSERRTLNEQLRVAMPGIIQSFDPESVTAVVQPAIRYIERDNDGNQSTQDYP